MMALGIFFFALMQSTGREFTANALLSENVISLYRKEIYALAIVFFVVIMMVLLFSKEIAAITFHQKMAEISGIRVQPVFYLFLLLIAIMVALCLPIVGGLLLYVWLVTPAAIVYQFCATIRQMFIAAPIVAACTSVTGAFVGIVYSLPVGPLTAMFFSEVFIFAVAFSPKRKVIVRYINTIIRYVIL